MDGNDLDLAMGAAVRCPRCRGMIYNDEDAMDALEEAQAELARLIGVRDELDLQIEAQEVKIADLTPTPGCPRCAAAEDKADRDMDEERDRRAMGGEEP